MNNGKIWVWIIVVVAILAGILWYISSSSSGTQTPSAQTGTQTQPTSMGSNTMGGGTSPSSNSNTAISQYAATIDAQMSGLSSDNSNADKGLSNQ